MLQPQAWNKYAYALNNPLRYIDLFGLRWAERTVDGNIYYQWFANDEEYNNAIDSNRQGYQGWTAVHFDESRPYLYNVSARNFDELHETFVLNPNGTYGYYRDLHGLDSGIEGTTTDWNAQFAIGGLLNGLRGAAMGLLEGLFASGSKGAATTAAEETVTLWRAVTQKELDDIAANNAFRNPAGLEVKYFSTSAEGATQYGRMASSAFGDGPYTLVQTSIPKNLITSEMRAVVDRGIGTVTVPTNILPSLSRPVVAGGIR